MSNFFPSFAAVFKMKISALFGFGSLCFLTAGIMVFIICSYFGPQQLFFGAQVAKADLLMPVEILPFSHDQQAVSDEKVIFVSLQDQTLVYMEGGRIMGEFKISSGLPTTPTPPGEYSVIKKKPLVNYGGPGYYLPNTKWNLMFKTGNPLNYYIHGAYWHDNFGKPMSHGCVNVAYDDMEALYNWADEGTKIFIIQETLDTIPFLNSGVYPTPPGSITTNKIGNDSANLSWNPASDPAGIAGYEIYQNNFFIGTSTQPTYEAVGLYSETPYRFAVFSYNQSGKVSFQPRTVNVTTLQKRE